MASRLGTVLSTISLLISSLLGASAGAEVAYVTQVRRLDADTRRLETELREGRGNREAQATAARALVRTAVDELDAGFADAVVAILDRLQTPSSAYLQRLKDEIDADLRRVRGTSDERESPLRDPRNLTLDRIDPVVRPLLIAHLRAGNPTPVVELLELCAAYVNLSAAYLHAKHVEHVTTTENAASVPWVVYLRTQESFEYAMVIARTFFATLPDFSFGQAAGEEAGRAIVTPFVQGFVDVRGGFPEALGVRLRAALQEMKDATARVENYRLVYFPRQSAEAQLKHLAISLYSMQGADDCIQLASGKSMMDGQLCQPALFRRNIDRFLGFFDRNADHGVMQLVLSYLREYRAGEYGAVGTDDAWNRLRDNIEAVGLGNVSPQIERVWPRIVQALLAPGAPGVRDPARRNLRVLLEDNAPAMDIFRRLQREFAAHGIGYRREQGRLFAAGFIEDYTAEVSAVRAVREGFRTNVERPLETSVLVEVEAFRTARTAREAAFRAGAGRAPHQAETENLRSLALLDTLQAKTVRFDASNEWCEFFRAADPTSPERRRESPWVVNNERTARQVPASQPTSNGFQRLLWHRDARFSNALTVQNADRSRKMFAGVAVKLAVGLIVPNVVHARLLMEDFLGEVRSDTLPAFGVLATERGVLTIAQGKYVFPDYDSVVTASRIAFRDMLRRYAFRKGLLRIEGEERLEPRVYLERVNALFERNYGDILRRFGEDFRREMTAAAEAIRRWDTRIAAVTAGGVEADAPTLLDELLTPEGAVAWRQVLRREAAAVNRTLVEMNDLFKRTFRVHQMMDDGRIPQRLGRAEILRRARAMEVPRNFQLTPEQFRQHFWWYGLEFVPNHMHKELLGFDGGMWNRDGQGELIRQRMHEHTMNIRDRRLEYMEYARNLLLYRFPALKLNDGFRTYDGSEAMYRRYMRRYLDNALEQANKFQRLGGTRWFGTRTQYDEDQQATAILDEVMPNLPLIDVILKFFPDQKAFVCRERHARGLTEAAYDAFFRGAGYVGMACSLIGALGTGMTILGVTAAIPGVNVIAAIGVGIFFVCALASTHRAYERWREVDAARSFELAAQPQMGFEQDVKNMDYVRDMQRRYDEAWYAAAVDLTLLSASVIPGVRGLREAAQAGARSVRVGVAGYFLRLPMRLFTAPGREAIAAPLRNWKIISDWTRKTLRERFTAAFAARVPPRTAAQARRSIHAAGFAPIRQTLGFLKDIVVELPWSLIGKQWANSTRAQLLFWGITAADLAALGYTMNAWVSERAQARVMDALYENPRDHEDLVALMRAGQLSNGELVGIMEIDHDLSARYLQEVQRQLRLISDNLDLQMRGDDEAGQRITNAQRNIDAIYAAMLAEFEALPANAAGRDPRYWALRRKVEEMRVIRGQWAHVHR